MAGSATVASRFVTVPELRQINLVAREIDASVAFYRLLGLEIDAQPRADHVEIAPSNGVSIELDSVDSVGHWDSGWSGSDDGRGGVVLGFALSSSDDVDARYAALTAAGYRAQQAPYDAFWGARYAIVEDPDGNAIGLMGPADADSRYWPPTTPPKV
ncbi:MAG: hypothetical protein QOF20_1151 [Acidimicrobiaceae bacterium]|nr:hypothetical protein [Acidimicrobiaceae bacterium]MDQ1368798.1 hypothetical protein [Acidimicrobiaceae bacterium]MDQ1378660.1 hypothetical protein [Acidimicrobiaceae bacterium]MDQ1399897.1 hypothetical protein [Acidimicrobiaceae bacterium]MDQ1414281.1 hypothetical protein [Acidimicrobiaceae bacterium]